MKKSGFINLLLAIISILFIIISFTDCKKTDNSIKYPKGTFPDTVINIADINSQYDDYNLDILQFLGYSPIIFSSNRKSAGGQFDLEQAGISYSFDQNTGVFGFGARMTTDPFLDKLINKATTQGNDFGPYTLFSAVDGYEYLLISSLNTEGNLDLFYLKHQPVFGTNLPDVSGPFPVKHLNTGADDAYICFNSNQDSAYFVSNFDGNFDILLQKKPTEQDLPSWFSGDYSSPSRVDSINSTYEDKCPFIYKKIMIFTSNRPGGLGGYDLYYSIFKNGKWNSPVNLGPRINSSSDEYRPVIGFDQDFTNKYLIFSSNRPGGKGGFDLFFTGFDFPSN